ncbi:MAG TPA: adenylate/guanylate cyclase domain-containing protein [Candidatus Limnocylindria bacterium]|nr:adenylate/guanylate cyclase domain-containing protein [Candidatus Limnocylindria bacterium]
MTAREVRKTVTIVFADVTGSTSLGERLDPESTREVMNRYFQGMRGVLERHGGTIEKFIGDAVVAVFGVPTLHDDDALRAVRAASEMRAVLGQLSDALERESGVRIEARIGVNTGEVVAGDPGSGQTFVTGDCVNVAARLQQNAAPGEIVIGDATRALVRDAVRAERLEPLVAKGKSAPVIAWRLQEVIAGAPAIARRRDVPMVGRGAELAQLRRSYDDAKRERSCQLLTFIGAPGIGKSRLADEFVASVAAEARVVAGHSLEYGDGITYWPIAEILRQLGGVERSVVAIPDAVERGVVLGHLRLAIGEAAGGGTTAEIFWAARKLLEALARETPLVVVLDDLQWAEPTFLDLVEYLVTLVADAPVLAVCLARPELLDARPGWSALGRSARVLPLGALSPTESTALLEADQAIKTVPSADRTRIIEAGGGNPLFLQQMLAMIREGATPAAVPPTVQALIAARLDRIPPHERVLLDLASVEGQVFHHGALRELSDGADQGDIATRLVALVRRELIRQDRTLFPGDDAFRFDHVLIRDVAYASIPKTRRAEVHERLATWLGQMPGEFDEIVGYHFEQAHRYRIELRRNDDRAGELARRASEPLAAAGRRAFTRGDMAASANLLGRAAALSAHDRQSGELLVMLGSALARVGDLARADRVLGDAIDAAVAADDRRLELHARVERAAWRLWVEPGSAAAARRLAEDAIARFGELGDDRGLARACRLLGDAETTWHASAGALERAVAYARRSGDDREGSDALWWIGVAMHFGPMPAQDAIRRCEAILAEVGADRTLEAGMRGILAGLLAMRGQYTEARELYASGFAILEQLGLKLRMATRRTISGAVELLAGDPVAAERELRWGFERLEQIGERIDRPGIAAQLAEALYQQGRFEEAERFVEIADQVIPGARVRYRFAVRAKMLARRGEFDRAEALAREVVALAEPDDNLNMRGHTLMDLAEVMRLADKIAESRHCVETALHLYERKGNAVSAAAARALLGG